MARESVVLTYAGKASIDSLIKFLEMLPGITAIAKEGKGITFQVEKFVRANGMGNRTLTDADYKLLPVALALLSQMSPVVERVTTLSPDTTVEGRKKLWLQGLSSGCRAIKRHKALSTARTMHNSTAVSHLISTLVREGVPMSGVSTVDVSKLIA